jgi:hypothetical protein
MPQIWKADFRAGNFQVLVLGVCRFKYRHLSQNGRLLTIK